MIEPDSEAFKMVANESEFDGFGIGEMNEDGEIVEETLPVASDDDYN